MAVALGVGYAAVGVGFAVPVSHAHAWRLSAWAVSALGFAAHIAYERFRLENSPGPSALHIALAVALGGFGLAVGANVHSLIVGSSGQQRQLLLLSLVLWPLITSLPAFVVALVANVVLARALALRSARPGVTNGRQK
jgi:hypothetical protein